MAKDVSARVKAQQERERLKEEAVEEANAARIAQRKAAATVHAKREGRGGSGYAGLPLGAQVPLHLANKLSVDSNRAAASDTEATVRLVAQAIRSGAKRGTSVKPLRAKDAGEP